MKFPIRQDLTVLGPDNPKTAPVGWKVQEVYRTNASRWYTPVPLPWMPSVSVIAAIRDGHLGVMISGESVNMYVASVYFNEEIVRTDDSLNNDNTKHDDYIKEVKCRFDEAILQMGYATGDYSEESKYSFWEEFLKKHVEMAIAEVIHNS